MFFLLYGSSHSPKTHMLTCTNLISSSVRKMFNQTSVYYLWCLAASLWFSSLPLSHCWHHLYQSSFCPPSSNQLASTPRTLNLTAHKSFSLSDSFAQSTSSPFPPLLHSSELHLSLHLYQHHQHLHSWGSCLIPITTGICGENPALWPIAK